MTRMTPPSAAPTMEHLQLQRVESESWIGKIAALEAASYPADEAASEAQVRYRWENAGDFFLATTTHENGDTVPRSV